MEEIIKCPYCRLEYSLLYQDDKVISQAHCNCKPIIKRINGKKPLDYALEVLNAKNIRRSGKISKSIKTGRQGS